MVWTKTSFGTVENGAEVFCYTLSNKNGVSASFTDLGGIWPTMVVPDRDGHLDDVVLGYDTAEKCIGLGSHLGEIVGRNANRTGGTEFMLNGTTYMLEQNSGKNNLHSGPDYYRDRIWDTEMEETGPRTKITFSLFNPGGDQGYPGNASIAVSYTLMPSNSLKLDYHMVADADTVANFTNHSYFNLTGHQSRPAMAQQVWTGANTFTAVDETSIPTGELVPVEGTSTDFTTMKAIERDINVDYEPLTFAGGYDHDWVSNHPEDELALSAKAYGEEPDRIMEVYTNLPGVQFYTANSFSGAGKDSIQHMPRCGYCFETQYFPDAINKPGFPSPVLKAREEYQTTTIYRFLTDK